MDPTIDTETGESISSGRSPRFSLWTAFLVFATMVMISAIQVVRFVVDSLLRQDNTFVLSYLSYLLSRQHIFVPFICFVRGCQNRKMKNLNHRVRVDISSPYLLSRLFLRH